MNLTNVRLQYFFETTHKITNFISQIFYSISNTMPYSRLDKVYRKMVLTKFFTKGWGKPENLMRLFAFRKLISNRETCYQLVSKDHPVTIIQDSYRQDCRIIEGKFHTPFAIYHPDIVPNEVQDAYFQMVLPLKWQSSKHKAICIHLAGTGDHYYWRRRNFMAKPLLKADIGSIILENPYYGLRKPKTQIRSCLHNVSDLFIMGGCIILECMVLLNWCEANGYGPLGLSGVSMGGHMASLAATNWPKPVVLVPCLSWSSASAVFTEGVMSDAIDWDLLQEQYQNDSLVYERLSNLVTIIDKSCFSKLKDNKISLKEVNSVPLIGKNFAYRYLNSRQFYYMEKIRQSRIMSSKFVAALRLPKYVWRKNHPLLKKPRNAVMFMRGIMDECTHLKNYSVPVDTSLITVVCAKADGYVPREGCSSLAEIWPGAEIRYLRAGHVSAYVFYRKFFRNCIIETFSKAKDKRKIKIAQ